jgi:hypothetical protein
LTGRDGVARVRAGHLEWFGEHLRIPSGPSYGQPLWLTDEQARLVLRWYAVDDRGRFVYRRGSARRPKGWGKSPLLAAIALAELAGPTLFDGWDSSGAPVGRPHGTPWVQIAAVSEDQTDNTYLALYNMVAMGSTADDLGLDVGRTTIRRPTGNGILEPVTAAAGSREGQPITFAVLDETHLWTPRNGGVKLAATLRRNAAKMGGRTFESTNAFRPGEKSVAEGTHKAADKGQKGLLYDAVEGPWVEELSDKTLMLPALQVAYGDSSWVDLDRIFEDANDQDTTESDARRFYLNQLVASEDDYIPGREWDDCRVDRGEPEPGTLIVAGFDGSRFHDATALIGVDAESGRMFNVGVWERDPDDPQWEVPRHEVNAAVARMFGRWRVARFYCDPPDWDSEVADWHARHGDVVFEYHTNSEKRMSEALKAFRNAVKTRELSHEGDPYLSTHVLNARLDVRIPAGAEDDPERHVWRIRKPVRLRKIDACVAGVLAWKARIDAIADGALEPVPAPDIAIISL